MPNITPLPVPPTRQDPANFNDRADEFLSALEDPFVPELNALRAEVLAAQTSANAGASTATNAANTATAAANATLLYSNATMWNAGTNYAVGDVVISPTNFMPYRRLIAGTTATDPASDATNWLNIGAVLLTGNQTIAGAKTFSSPIVGSTNSQVSLTGDQTIAGVKTFSSQIVGSTNTQVSLTGNQTVAGVKTFSSSPIVPNATTSTQAVNKSQLDAVAAASGGMTLLGTLNTTSGSTQTLSGLNLTSYQRVYVRFDSSLASGSTIRINGADATDNLGTSSSNLKGFGWIDLVNQTYLGFAKESSSSTQVRFIVNTAINQASTAITFTTGSTFDAGTIQLYGEK
jgi:hypothetical protein